MKRINHISFATKILGCCIVGLTTILSACKSGSNVADGQIEISGRIIVGQDGEPLKDAIVTNNRTEKSVLSDSLGRFSVHCNVGDTLSINYVGLVTQIIPVNPKDSTEWNVSLREYGPMIEPMLQHSVSTLEGVTMSVENLNNLKIPVDSLVVEIRNNTDKELLFGEKYTLEKQSDGKWIPMPYNRKYEDGECVQVFTAIGYIYAPQSTHKNVIHTQPFSRKFDKGIYRLTKDFSIETVAGWTERDSISVVFEIQ